MTDQRQSPRAGRRAQKTWSAFGELRRRPTEYEILTHGLNHTVGTPPLELGPDVRGNVWLREHRDSMKLKAADWNSFRDPDAVTYGSYVAMQDDQETFVEGLLERFDRDDHDAGLTPRATDFLALAITPGRYLAHGQQMLSAYLQQLAMSSYVSNCAAFQTADQLRRVQLLAYRTTQLGRTHRGRGFGTGERETWERHPDWQPIRSAVEHALIEFDWDRALVAGQLVVKPVADLLFLDQLPQDATHVGAPLDGLIAENLWRDSERSRRWTGALLVWLVSANPENRSVLQGYLDEWAPRGNEMVDAGARLLATAGGRTAEHIASAVRADWAALLEPAGLELSEASLVPPQ